MDIKTDKIVDLKDISISFLYPEAYKCQAKIKIWTCKTVKEKVSQLFGERTNSFVLLRSSISAVELHGLRYWFTCQNILKNKCFYFKIVIIQIRVVILISTDYLFLSCFYVSLFVTGMYIIKKQTGKFPLLLNINEQL